jgi:hypothetical protein
LPFWSTMKTKDAVWPQYGSYTVLDKVSVWEPDITGIDMDAVPTKLPST